MVSITDPTWDSQVDRPPYRWRRSHIGRQAGCRQLGASLFAVAPGASTFPLHAHHANEELIIVLDGTWRLRTRDGERRLNRGDAIACPAHGRGAHQLSNLGGVDARVLILSTMIAPEVNEFPDSGLLWARTYPPGDQPGEDAVELVGVPRAFDPLQLP